MATTKLSAEQFANLVNGLKGVILVYKSVDREGDEKEAAQQFFGADYEPKDKTQNEIFRVWKNVVMTFWAVKAEEIKLREANDGIRSKLRATTPCAIIFRTANGETVKRFDLEESVWAKIGLVPTKKDFERTARDYKKAIHAAAKASFDALGFRVALPKDAEQPVEQPAENVVEQPVPQSAEVPAEAIVETAAETAAETVTEQVSAKGKGRGKGKNKATEQPIAEQPQEQPVEVAAEAVAETTAEVVTETEQQPVAEMEVAA
ncbi:MAG: hypothetical protein LUD40_12490 [Phocaeicola dorei]|nr:hypothetical protein [Phocaeicola dorei]